MQENVSLKELWIFIFNLLNLIANIENKIEYNPLFFLVRFVWFFIMYILYKAENKIKTSKCTVDILNKYRSKELRIVKIEKYLNYFKRFLCCLKVN